MNLVKQLFDILKKPFPEQNSSFGSPRITILVSLFVTFFLYIFEPFGISILESNQFWVCLGFGAMTFVGVSLFDFITGPMLKLKGELENWTFGKWILNNFGILISVSLANFLFARWVLFGYIQWDLYPIMLYSTFMIGIIPIVVLGGYSVLSQEKKYQNLASELSPQLAKHTDLVEKEEQFLFEIP